ncbi:PREDICTED: cadherin-10-like [Propithecus coquereli]|uniref:cadherin-10-like n=1 Tax=Propithecus coquereli TaxID=379532 RepID=UPI00063ED495|nr:PREDICTED: cadherin-10-like [Propithecus coquereli]
MTIYQFLLLFLLWVCLPHFCSPEIMFRRTPVPQQRILSARVPRSDGKILHRQKRGWMWNQFFLLEEYTGSDYQYVGKLHSDQDKGDGSLKYILSGDGAGTLFIIDEKTGDIHATRRIDREEKAFYTLRAQAINRRTLRPVEPESEFVIKIHDINDNEPTFPEEIYTASVPEMSVVDTIHLRVLESSPVGTAIGSVKATDADTGKNAEVEYRIIDGDGTDMFDIITEKDTQEGIITVKKVHSISTNQHLFSLDRHTDLDRIFNIHSGNGSLYTSKPLDRELSQWHNLTVIAAEITRKKIYANPSPKLFTSVLNEPLICLLVFFQVIVVLFAALKRQRKKEPLILSKEDIRDNIVSYNDEGGGEEDTQAFDIGTLRNPAAIEEKKLRRDIIPETLFIPRRTPTAPDNTDVRDFINERLKEHDLDPTAPPYDSLATYAYEGNDSIAESLSSLESGTTEGDQNYDYLREWGPRFNKLAEMYGGGESDKDS